MTDAPAAPYKLIMAQSPEQRLQWAVQALALGAEEQLKLFPDFVEIADELAMDYEEAQAGFQPEQASPELIEAMQALDDKLGQMSERRKLWKRKSLKQSEEWAQVRRLAAELLQAAGWPAEPPPRPSKPVTGPFQ